MCARLPEDSSHPRRGPFEAPPPVLNQVLGVFLEDTQDYQWAFDGVPESVSGLPPEFLIRVDGVWYSPTGINYVSPGTRSVGFHYDCPDQADVYASVENTDITFDNALALAAASGTVD